MNALFKPAKKLMAHMPPFIPTLKTNIPQLNHPTCPARQKQNKQQLNQEDQK